MLTCEYKNVWWDLMVKFTTNRQFTSRKLHISLKIIPIYGLQLDRNLRRWPGIKPLLGETLPHAVLFKTKSA